MKHATLSSFLSHEAVVKRLRAHGLAEESSRDVAGLIVDGAGVLLEGGVDGGSPATGLYVPGRLEVLGKHTDYAGGRSLIAALERGIGMIAVPRSDDTIRAFDISINEQDELVISADLAPEIGHWSNYLMTVARRVARDFGKDLKGLDLALGSNLPMAAGMSSSSALMVGCFLAMSFANELATSEEYTANIQGPEMLASYLGCVENGQGFGTLRGDQGVGTVGGSEDHTAMLCAVAGRLSEYAYGPVRLLDAVNLAADHVFVISFSGVSARKTGEARARYNRAADLARIVTDRWNEATGRNDAHLADALASGADAAAELRATIQRKEISETTPNELLNRLDHFVAEETEILPEAVQALKAGDIDRFSTLVDRSQALAESLLGNQIEETSFLALSARDEGALAASAFGAGFGGSVWALVRREEALRFAEVWAERYRTLFPDRGEESRFFLSGAGPPVCILG